MSVKMAGYFNFRFMVGQNFKGFSHNHNELIFIQSGKGTVTINGKHFEYGPNSLLVLMAGGQRDQITEELTEYMCIRYIQEGNHPSIMSGVYECHDDTVARLFLELKKEYNKKQYRYFDFCNLTISQLLIAISRLTLRSMESKDLYGVIQYIDESQGYIKSIKEMADETGYSYDHFRHKFKQITGQSPTDYIMNKRIDNACRLLEEEGYNCTEVSILCGFSSPAHFSKIFKKKMGISPKSIRNMT